LSPFFVPQAAKGHFDNALCRYWGRLCKAGVSAQTWVKAHKGLCALVMPKAELDVVTSCAAEEPLPVVAVQRLMDSCKTGKAVFATVGCALSASSFQAAMGGHQGGIGIHWGVLLHPLAYSLAFHSHLKP
jgi:hypothetical protein